MNATNRYNETLLSPPPPTLTFTWIHRIIGMWSSRNVCNKMAEHPTKRHGLCEVDPSNASKVPSYPAYPRTRGGSQR